ncbi:unnamed protein product [Didymodactylos carnosus]|uniref:C2H2-type domain-containing protein n=1 Tax=Didymodactylos carnosus TaxID=1234261 RepID=A0A814ILB4_9BILA|nr:unnamed protein product [Didymodactylos carnosus]CAF1026162.1 unnamed protein product [Didymodactylos carnosus]CAF3726270.1 unnamed protein product [Didymodactylos carnosus]CAF3797313.1 unnamed protein product [Didymodactylos carnosus]
MDSESAKYEQNGKWAAGQFYELTYSYRVTEWLVTQLYSRLPNQGYCGTSYLAYYTSTLPAYYEETVIACHSYDGVKRVQAVECKLISLKEKTTLSIPKITTINNFGFEKNGRRVHRAWNIGSGKLIQWKDLKQSTTASRNVTTAEIHHDIQTSPSKLHECPEEGCIAAFIKKSNLITHMASGKHRRKVERIPMKDQAMQMYHSKFR